MTKTDSTRVQLYMTYSTCTTLPGADKLHPRHLCGWFNGVVGEGVVVMSDTEPTCPETKRGCGGVLLVTHHAKHGPCLVAFHNKAPDRHWECPWGRFDGPPKHRTGKLGTRRINAFASQLNVAGWSWEGGLIPEGRAVVVWCTSE